MWDRTLNKVQRPLVAILTDIILPSDDEKPSASDLQIPDFIDEWISAPYERQQKDRVVILTGLKWINKEARKRFKKGFVKLSATQQLAICNDISDPVTAKPFYKAEVAFFLLLQKLLLQKLPQQKRLHPQRLNQKVQSPNRPALGPVGKAS